MNNTLRQELLAHMEATSTTQAEVSRKTGINVSQLSRLRSGKGNLGPCALKRLDAYLAEVNNREVAATGAFDKKPKKEKKVFAPKKPVRDIVNLRELMKGAYDSAYQVYFYEDHTFDIVSRSGSKALSEKPQSRGYRGYTLKHDDYGPEGKTLISHRLVATYYHPNPENKPQVNHIDGNKANNHPDNLEWVTPKENIHHAMHTGLITRRNGEDHHMSKLTKEEAMAIRIRRDHRKDKINDLADVFGVSSQNIQSIIYRKTWTHLDDKPVAVHIDLVTKGARR